MQHIQLKTMKQHYRLQFCRIQFKNVQFKKCLVSFNHTHTKTHTYKHFSFVVVVAISFNNWKFTDKTCAYLMVHIPNVPVRSLQCQEVISYHYYASYYPPSLYFVFILVTDHLSCKMLPFHRSFISAPVTLWAEIKNINNTTNLSSLWK